MPETPATVTTTIRLPRAMVETIDEMRERPGLSRNGMIAVLLAEAIDARR